MNICKPKKKILVYGGSFDPITKAHMRIARKVMKANYGFEKLWFMPAYKSMWGKDLNSGKDRINMIKSALCDIPYNERVNFSVCDFEIANKITGPTYGVLKQMLKAYGDCEFYFLIGMDNANKMDEWEDGDKIRELVKFVVVPRAGERAGVLGNAWYGTGGNIYIGMDTSTISSTQSRDELKKRGWTDTVSTSVLGYIIGHGLYGVEGDVSVFDSIGLVERTCRTVANLDTDVLLQLHNKLSDNSDWLKCRLIGNGIWAHDKKDKSKLRKLWNYVYSLYKLLPIVLRY